MIKFEDFSTNIIGCRHEIKILAKNLFTNLSQVVLDLAGREFNQALDLSFNENGKSLSLTDSLEKFWNRKV